MSTTVLFVGVVVFAFVAGRVLERFTTKAFALSGVEYLLLGVLLGPFVLGILDQQVLLALDLFVSTVLGVIGFLVGLEIRRVRASTEAFLAGGGTTAAVIVGVGAASTTIIQVLDPALLSVEPLMFEPLTATASTLVSLWVSPEALWIGLTIGAAAGTCSAALVATAINRYEVSEERARLLRAMASAAQLLAVFTFGFAMAGSRATIAASALGLTIVEWAIITILSGGFTGLLFSIFLGREGDPMRLLVAGVGVIVFAAGVGAALGVSPLFANLFAGLTLALTSSHAAQLDEALRPLRFPTTVLVLLLAGATLTPVGGWYLALVPGYLLLRTLTLRVFSRLAVSTFVGDSAPGIGRALLGHGVLASAISLAFAQRFPDLAGPVTTTILGGVVLTDLFAMGSLRRYLADAGEIKALAAPQPAPAEAMVSAAEAVAAADATTIAATATSTPTATATATATESGDA
ncbi:MAG: cation:proton antiporter [Nannocystaceae bacterium]